MTGRRVLILFLLLTFGGPLWLVASGSVDLAGNWRTASREPMGLAPTPNAHPEALVHVYAARAFKWRGAFAVHTWISAKPANASTWTVYQVVGWRKWRGLPVVARDNDAPDRQWYGEEPELIGKLTGEAAQRAIPGI